MRRFLARFFEKFMRDETTTLAASLAFYTAFSLAPLVILFVAITSRFSDDLQTSFVSHVRGVIGLDASRTVEIIIDGAKARADLTSVAGTLGVVMLLLSGSLIFGQLRLALNRIFSVQMESPWQGWAHLAWQYLLEKIALIGLSLIFLLSLIASLLASSLISSTIHFELRGLMLALNILFSTVFYLGLFTLVFRYLPDRHQPWRTAFRSGLVTALMFEIGKEFIGLYLGKSAVASAYGAAGSLMALLVWVYYSTLITFIGAQVGALWKRPSPNANTPKS